MKPSDFVTDASGTVKRMPTGYYAFIPTPPPLTLDFNPLALLLSAADAALSELSGLGRYLPNPHLLIQPYLRREAAASTKIEGTQANLNDLYVDEVFPAATPSNSDVIEIRNYVRAMEFGRAKLSELPIAARFVREVHAVLLSDARGKERLSGEYRKSQNWIGGRGPEDAYFVPPPPEDLWHCIGDWEQFVNLRSVLPELVQCALMHAHLETIHPFLDGNGRIGRLLMTLFLIERNRLSEPLLYVSAFIEQNKSRYYECLQRTRTHADWTGWVRYFLEAVVDSAKTAVNDAKRLLDLRDGLRSRAELANKHRELRLIDALFVNPYVTIARTQTALTVAEATAKKSIFLLESLGILREITGRPWGRMWIAEPVRELLEGKSARK